MTLPTLMIKGSLKSPIGDQADPKFLEELAEQRPIDYIINWFGSKLNLTGIENRVLILKSETASGKSTSLPPAIYRRFIHGSGGPGLICTQPRVLTAIENVNEMLKWNSDIMRLGQTAGWSTQYNKLKPKKTALLSATIGTLAQILKVSTDEEIMNKFRFILIDETHERDLQTDTTIYMLKNMINRVKDKTECPFVVLMSATFDPDPLLEYFKVPKLTNFIWCGGATARIDEMWEYIEKSSARTYIEAAAQCTEHICREGVNDIPDKGDILIFLPGGGEMTKVAALLNKVNKKLANESLGVMSILKIDSGAVNSYSEDMKKLIDIPLADQLVYIDGKEYSPKRRLIMSTNVAETGLTLDGLKYVIDAGFNRETEYNPIYGTTALLTKPAPRSRIRQRRGRSGRKFPGVFYPLYTNKQHDSLPLLQYPQILTNDIGTIMLDIIKEQIKVKKMNNLPPVFRIKDIDMIDQPTPDALTDAMSRLHSLGFISIHSMELDFDEVRNSSLERTKLDKPYTQYAFGLTPMGVIATAFGSMQPETIRMLLAGYAWNVALIDLIPIVIYLQLEGEKGVNGVSPEWKKDNPNKIAPGVNWRTVYGASLSGFLSEESLLYKVRLLVGDNFIDGLFLMNAIIQIISKPELFASITSLKNWCEANFISYETCVKMLQKRDEFIEQLMSEGFNIYEGDQLSKISPDYFMDHIVKLKHCIYDGYRNNIITLKGADYYAKGIKIKTPILFREDEKNQKESKKYNFVVDTLPKTLVYSGLGLKLNKKTNMFIASAKMISVLDGFIAIDEMF